ncbi:MAG: 2-C-methyl-D-erythritol 2,4-cyclodiphosphate synthase [Phycisphaerales bacterium]|nr:2-C-methyl-D-erythritol 2,4-cyclodiphosphate synthase [Phycisphaerales bacterium]
MQPGKEVGGLRCRPTQQEYGQRIIGVRRCSFHRPVRPQDLNGVPILSRYPHPSSIQGPPPPEFRVGHGYDLHRLEPLPPKGKGQPLILGGIPVVSDTGPIGHSDGDALLHALTDAILGAIGSPDIGQLFPDNAPENAGRDSADFLAEALKRARKQGWLFCNCDCTIILERPKLSPVKEEIRANLAQLLDQPDTTRINLKGKTHEKVDAVGEGRAIEVHAVVMLAKGLS